MSPHWLKQHHLHLSSVQNPFLLPLYWLVNKDSPSGSLYSPRWWPQSSSNRGLEHCSHGGIVNVVYWSHDGIQSLDGPGVEGDHAPVALPSDTHISSNRRAIMIEVVADMMEIHHDWWYHIGVFFWWLIIVVSQCSLLQQTWAPHGLGLAGEHNISWTRHHWFMAGLITINHHELLVISIYHHQTTINQPLSTMNHQQATMKNHSWTQQNSV